LQTLPSGTHRDRLPRMAPRHQPFVANLVEEPPPPPPVVSMLEIATDTPTHLNSLDTAPLPPQGSFRISSLCIAGKLRQPPCDCACKRSRFMLRCHAMPKPTPPIRTHPWSPPVVAVVLRESGGWATLPTHFCVARHLQKLREKSTRCCGCSLRRPSCAPEKIAQKRSKCECPLGWTQIRIEKTHPLAARSFPSEQGMQLAPIPDCGGWLANTA